MLSDPLLITCIVGVAVSGLGAAACLYLWNEDPSERHLLFWVIGFFLNLVRWAIHYKAESSHGLRMVEALLVAAVLYSVMLGAYSLLPKRPWQMRPFAWTVTGISTVYLISSVLAQKEVEFGYGLAIAAWLFSAWCLWKTYLSTRMSGYAFSAFGMVLWGAVSAILLTVWGKEAGNAVALPLTLLLPLSGFVLIAYQRALRRSRLAEQTMRTVFDTVPIPVTINRPPHGEYELANQAALRAVQLTGERIYGKTSRDAGIIVDASARQAIYDELAASGVVTDREITWQLENSERRIFSVNASRLDLEDGTKYVFAYYDLTERYRTAETLRALNASLESRVRERTSELEAANHELEAFSYSVAHDLRSPLRAVDGFARILLEASDEPSRKRAQDRILAAVKRMNDIIEDLLGLARVGRQEIVRQPVALEDLAREILESLRERNPERSVTVQVNPTGMVNCDRALVTIVLENLLGNAWKFTGKRADAKIEFGARATPGGKVAYFVADNGAGFDPEFTDRLFTAFQRLHGEKEFEGSGIGLAIVKRIVVRHGGQVWAESKPGIGATFSFTLG